MKTSRSTKIRRTRKNKNLRKKKTLKGGMFSGDISSFLRNTVKNASDLTVKAASSASATVAKARSVLSSNKAIRESLIPNPLEILTLFKLLISKPIQGIKRLLAFNDKNKLLESIGLLIKGENQEFSEYLTKIKGETNQSVSIKNFVANRMKMHFSYVPDTISSESKMYEYGPDDEDKVALKYSAIAYKFSLLKSSPQEEDSKQSSTNIDSIITEIIKDAIKEEENTLDKWIEISEPSNKLQIGLNFIENLEWSISSDQQLNYTYTPTFSDGAPSVKKVFTYKEFCLAKSPSKKPSYIPKFFLFKLGTQMIITVRGTSNFSDALIDIQAGLQSIPENYVSEFSEKLRQCRFHKGFLNSALCIYELIKTTYIYQLSDVEKILLCGHSMGGAVASILGLLINDYFLTIERNKSVSVICFNPGTYICPDTNYDNYQKDIKSKSTSFKIKSFCFSGDLISVCNFKNCLVTACLLAQNRTSPEVAQLRHKLEKLEEKIYNNEVVTRTDFHDNESVSSSDFHDNESVSSSDYQQELKNNFKQISQLDLEEITTGLFSLNPSDILTIQKEKSDMLTIQSGQKEQYQFFEGSFESPIIFNKKTIDAHSLKNFMPLFLGEEGNDFQERFEEKEETTDKFISQMITLYYWAKNMMKTGTSTFTISDLTKFQNMFEKISKAQETFTKLKGNQEMFTTKLNEMIAKLSKEKDDTEKFTEQLTPEKISEELTKCMSQFNDQLSSLPDLSLIKKEKEKFSDAFKFLKNPNSSDTVKLLQTNLTEKGIVIPPELITQLTPVSGGSLKRRKIGYKKKLSLKKKEQTGGGPAGMIVSIIVVMILVLNCPGLCFAMMMVGGFGPILIMVASFGGP